MDMETLDRSLSGQEVRRVVLERAMDLGWNEQLAGDAAYIGEMCDLYERAEMEICALLSETENLDYNVYMARICGVI